jgi:MoaA/NifB/PqqE/SkfB family radical SAM enzyme
LGQVTGILTNGDRLSEPEYLQQLLQSGLDHVMILLEPEDEPAWEGYSAFWLKISHTTVHLTIHSENLTETEMLLNRLSGMGVTSVSLSTTDLSLKDALEAGRTMAAEMGMELVWDVPVPYSNNNPVAFELMTSEVPPAGAGQAWIYIEPDGDVLPAQGVNKVMGNLLNDPWEAIWQNR